MPKGQNRTAKGNERTPQQVLLRVIELHPVFGFGSQRKLLAALKPAGISGATYRYWIAPARPGATLPPPDARQQLVGIIGLPPELWDCPLGMPLGGFLERALAYRQRQSPGVDDGGEPDVPAGPPEGGAAEIVELDTGVRRCVWPVDAREAVELGRAYVISWPSGSTPPTFGTPGTWSHVRGMTRI